jgi:hypothetical protein
MAQGVGRMPCHLLEVVEDHQAMAASRNGMTELDHGIFLAQRYVEPLGHGTGNAGHAACGREIAEPDATGKVAEPASAIARGQACLAGAAHTQDRQQPCARMKPLRHLGQRLGSADERVAFGGQVVPHLAGRQPQVTLPHDPICLLDVGRRREGRAVSDFEQLDRIIEALEAPVSMRLQMQTVVTQRTSRVGRQQDLTALGH